MMSSRRTSSAVSETSRTSDTSTASDTSCNRHQQRPLIVFCQDCGVALCDSCLSSAEHRRHTFLSLPEACKKLMDVLMKKSKDLTKLVKKSGNFTADTSSQKRLNSIEENFLNAKEHIDSQFKVLKNLLEANKKQAFKLLNAQRDVMKEKLIEIKQNEENMPQVIADIRGKLEMFRMQDPDSVSLKEILEEEIRIKSIEKTFVNQQEDSEQEDLRLKSLKNSVNAILQKTKECLPYPWEFADFITFDQNTAHKKLTVSDDKKQVFAKDLSRTYQLNSSLDTQVLNVKAEQSFTTGRHYWEVDVRGCQSWMVGLVAEAVEPGSQSGTSQLGHNMQSWKFMSDNGILSTQHNDDMTRVREQELLYLGVFIDCERGRLRFYNVATDVAMATFPFQCGRTMRPEFHIIPEEGESSCLVLCDICEDPRLARPAITADSSVSSLSDSSPNTDPRSASPAITADSSLISPNDSLPNDDPSSASPTTTIGSSVSSPNDPAPNTDPRSASPAVSADSSLNSPNDYPPNNDPSSASSTTTIDSSVDSPSDHAPNIDHRSANPDFTADSSVSSLNNSPSNTDPRSPSPAITADSSVSSPNNSLSNNDPSSASPTTTIDSSVNSPNDPVPNTDPRSASPAITADSNLSSPNDSLSNTQ